MYLYHRVRNGGATGKDRLRLYWGDSVQQVSCTLMGWLGGVKSESPGGGGGDGEGEGGGGSHVLGNNSLQLPV